MTNIDAQALIHQWPITPEQRQQLIDAAYDTLQHGPTHRDRMAGARVILAADRNNATRERTDAQSAHHDRADRTSALRAVLSTPEGRAQLARFTTDLAAGLTPPETVPAAPPATSGPCPPQAPPGGVQAPACCEEGMGGEGAAPSRKISDSESPCQSSSASSVVDESGESTEVAVSARGGVLRSMSIPAKQKAPEAPAGDKKKRKRRRRRH